jgi:hypothetical protein
LVAAARDGSEEEEARELGREERERIWQWSLLELYREYYSVPEWRDRAGTTRKIMGQHHTASVLSA